MNRNELKARLIDLIDSSLSGDELRLALEKSIDEFYPYDHKKSNPLDACGFVEDFTFELTHMGSLSTAVQKVTTLVSKRKLAFMFLRDISDKGSSTKSTLSLPDMGTWLGDMFKR